MARIICYGSLAVDRLIRLPRWIVPGDDLHALQEADQAGGTALNVGLTLHGWGHEVLIGGNVLGEDWAARLIERRLDELGLDRRWLASSAERSTVTCTILITPEGERTIVGHAFGVAQAGPLPPFAGAAALSIDNYGPDRVAIARQAKAAGLLVSASDVHEPDHPMLPLLDLVTYSRALAERQPGLGGSEAWVAALAAAGPRWIAITDGAAPARLWAEGRWHEAAPPPVKAIDTTGAGDTFRAGLLHGWLHGWAPQQALEWAARAGARRCLVLGAAGPLPAEGEV